MFGRPAKPIVVIRLAPKLKRLIVDRHQKRGHIARAILPHGDARKESCQFVKLLPLPAVCRMVVALSALDLDAEKDPRDFGRDVLGPSSLSHDQCRAAILADVACRRDEVSRDLAPGFVLIEFLGQILGQGVRRDQGSIFRSAIQDHIAPVASPILSKRFVRQQLLDNLFTLGFLVHERKRQDIVGRWRFAEQIQEDSPQKRLVRGSRSRFVRGQARLDDEFPVDLASGGKRIRTGRDCGALNQERPE